jgi:hypothetical protein
LRILLGFSSRPRSATRPFSPPLRRALMQISAVALDGQRRDVGALARQLIAIDERDQAYYGRGGWWVWSYRLADRHIHAYRQHE